MTNRNEIYLVSIDTRGKTPSDLECYKEHVCSRGFFEEHIHENPKNICVKSQVAGLCGLDLKIYFHEHDPFHNRYKDEFKRINGIATLLTFNPKTGYCNQYVKGKAYVLLNDGMSPLSKRQVWGIQELIHEAKDLYHQEGQPMTHEAHQELLTWCSQYQACTWGPHGIYEHRHPRHHYFHQRRGSGMSDQATYHHEMTHVHHDGHHECRHSNKEADVKTHPIPTTIML